MINWVFEFVVVRQTELIYRFLAKNMSMATGFPIMNQMTCDASNSTINSPEFKRIMAEEKFDLIIYGYFVNAFLFGMLFVCLLFPSQAFDSN